MTATTKISVYSLPDLKNTSDDALPNYLNSLGFKQSHYLTDVRLALGYSAVVIAGGLFYADWKLGWDETRAWTLPAVVVYFVLNGIFTWWLMMVEKGVVYVGTKDGVKLSITTSTDKLKPVYMVKAAFTAASKETKELNIEAPFSQWFSSDGYFIVKPFQQFFASGIPIVGAADPKNVVEEIGRGSGTSGSGTSRDAGQPIVRDFGVTLDNLPGVLEAIKAQGSTSSPRASSKSRRKG